jgi:hypothetical protein
MKELFKYLRHRLVHKLHWQYGMIVSWTQEGDVWIGFKCLTCGEVTGIHKSRARWSR